MIGDKDVTLDPLMEDKRYHPHHTYQICRTVQDALTFAHLIHTDLHQINQERPLPEEELAKVIEAKTAFVWDTFTALLAAHAGDLKAFYLAALDRCVALIKEGK